MPTNEEIKFKKNGQLYKTNKVEDIKQPEEYKQIVRKLNPKTEQYEYKEVIKNDKLEWDNIIEVITNNLEINLEKEYEENE